MSLEDIFSEVKHGISTLLNGFYIERWHTQIGIIGKYTAGATRYFNLIGAEIIPPEGNQTSPILAVSSFFIHAGKFNGTIITSIIFSADDVNGKVYTIFNVVLDKLLGSSYGLVTIGPPEGDYKLYGLLNWRIKEVGSEDKFVLQHEILDRLVHRIKPYFA